MLDELGMNCHQQFFHLAHISQWQKRIYSRKLLLFLEDVLTLKLGKNRFNKTVTTCNFSQLSQKRVFI